MIGPRLSKEARCQATFDGKYSSRKHAPPDEHNVAIKQVPSIAEQRQLKEGVRAEAGRGDSQTRSHGDPGHEEHHRVEVSRQHLRRATTPRSGSGRVETSEHPLD